MPKISALNEITTPEVTDTLAGVDDSADTTKYIQIGTLLKMIYPIGSIYTNATNDTNPATLFGFGTWVAFGVGKFPVGQDTADADFDVLSEVAGTKNHWHWQTVGADEQDLYIRNAGAGANPVNTKVQAASRVRIHRTDYTGDNGRFDGTEAATNVPPYIVVKMWRRTA